MDEAMMTSLRQRFGERVEDWPPPHRAEAQDFLASRDGGLRAALMMPTDEAALSQAVLTRLATPARPRFRLSPGPVLTGYAALLLLAGFVGYGGAAGLEPDPMLALLLGDVTMMEALQ